MLTLKGCRGNNQKNVTASFPVGCFAVVKVYPVLVNLL